MQESDSKRFKGLIEALAATFRVEPTTALLEGYWLGLEDLSITETTASIKRALRESKFMPSVAELRSLTGEMPPAVRAVQAWGELKTAMSRHGSWYSVDFEDKLINATVRSLGGWREIGMVDSDKFNTWTRKEFERVYVAFAQSGVGEDAGKHLAGHFETQNGASGHAVDGPIMIPMVRPKAIAKSPPERTPVRLASIPADDPKKAG